jgi:glyoxylase-like metal-dependent hydrolase (beta-lactamase superfamily II)
MAINIQSRVPGFTLTARRGAALILVAVAALLPAGGGVEASSQSGNQASTSATFEVLPVQGSVTMIATDLGNVAVQVGDEGLVVVDTMSTAAGDRLLATIQSISQRPLRYIINTSSDADRTGGNEQVAKAGEKFYQTAAINAPARYPTRIFAHENTLKWMLSPPPGTPKSPEAMLPTDTYFVARKELSMSHEPIEIIHLPAAHSNGDSVVLFRRSDVLVTGAAFTPDRYPVIDLVRGGSFAGYLAGLNAIVGLAVPDHNEQGGTLVVPGYGHLGDQSNIAEYRDMVTIVRDRVQDMLSKKMTLEQVKAARLTRDYDPLYSRPSSTGDQFVETVYRGLTPTPAGGSSRSGGRGRAQ